jgi:xanthine dehydrogenase YagS FAD-binding subunit
MHPFILERPRDLAAALAFRAQAGRNDAPAEYIAGGTDMVQLLQEYVRRPERLVSLAGLLDDRIEAGPQGLRLGAAATMAEVAAHPAVIEQFPVISEALLNSASPQVREPGHHGRQPPPAHPLPILPRCWLCGLQQAGARLRLRRLAAERWRCWHTAIAPAPTLHACVRARAFDIHDHAFAKACVAHALTEFHRLPGDTPHIETVLEPGEVITAITVPASPVARRSHYLKVRDRASFEFAVVSAAVALDMDGARIRQARIALGGVGTKPWRLTRVEAALIGASLDLAALRPAAALAAQGAEGRGHNEFKIELMQRAIVRGVEIAGARP